MQNVLNVFFCKTKPSRGPKNKALCTSVEGQQNKITFAHQELEKDSPILPLLGRLVKSLYNRRIRYSNCACPGHRSLAINILGNCAAACIQTCVSSVIRIEPVSPALLNCYWTVPIPSRVSDRCPGAAGDIRGDPGLTGHRPGAVARPTASAEKMRQQLARMFIASDLCQIP